MSLSAPTIPSTSCGRASTIRRRTRIRRLLFGPRSITFSRRRFLARQYAAPRRHSRPSSSVHQETSLCVACHATHFPQRAQLYATRNGYPVVQRQQLQFLSERFYNNPRPFYGFEEQGAVWARVISAPANVLGRMSHLMEIFEDEVSGERRASFHEGIAEYLKLYYAGRESCRRTRRTAIRRW